MLDGWSITHASVPPPPNTGTPHDAKQTADEDFLTSVSAGGEVEAVLLDSTAVSRAQAASLCFLNTGRVKLAEVVKVILRQAYE